MKIWIGASDQEVYAELFVSKPKEAHLRFHYKHGLVPLGDSSIMRDFMKKLLRGSGKRLPRHGSRDLVEGELTFK